MIYHIKESLKDARSALENLLNNDVALKCVEAAACALIQTFQNDGKAYSCGNGGSMCDSTHFAEELTGRYRMDRPSIAAIAINDPGHISCVANDFGYEYIFSRYIECHAKKGDCLIAISTSGNSKNIVKAVKVAKKLKVTTIVLTGKLDSNLAKLADICICTPAGEFADRIQELHIKVLHILIELVERKLFPQNYQINV
ncbi:MAG: SIS domain-containing protein [Thiohalomonadales bacterium]